MGQRATRRYYSLSSKSYLRRWSWIIIIIVFIFFVSINNL